MPIYFRRTKEHNTMESITYCDPDRIFCRANKVLLAGDGSEGAAKATKVAIEIAEMTNSKLFIVHVVPTPTVKQMALMTNMSPEDVMDKYVKNGEILLKGYKDSALEFDLDVETILEKSAPSEGILAVAKAKDVDLIVIGSKGTAGGRRVGMGSNTERIVVNSTCPVIVVK
ncbi:MAG: universal stress protein [Candidatus Thorarchaeota archaeon]|jgi:nucleotide-binding universal stress UspA family protein